MFIEILVISILLISILIGGRILHKRGRPYHRIIFAFHKIFAVGIIVLLTYIVLDYIKVSGWGFLLQTSVIIAVISGLVLFVSGGLLSLNKAYFLSLLMHRITSTLLLIASIGILIALYNR